MTHNDGNERRFTCKNDRRVNCAALRVPRVHGRVKRSEIDTRRVREILGISFCPLPLPLLLFVRIVFFFFARASAVRTRRVAFPSPVREALSFLIIAINIHPSRHHPLARERRCRLKQKPRLHEQFQYSQKYMHRRRISKSRSGSHTSHRPASPRLASPQFIHSASRLDGIYSVSFGLAWLNVKA